MKSICLASALVAMTALMPPGHGQPALASSDVAVELDKEDQARMGLESAMLEARTLPDSVEAIVRGVDPTPLVMLDSELAAAAAATAASNSELERTAGLAARDQSASQQALEAARVKAASDAATLAMLERQLALDWGPAISAFSPDARAELVTALAAARAALLRADALERPDGLEGRVLIQTTASEPPIAAESLGLTTTAEPRMQTIGLYCIVRGDAARVLRPGRVFPGRIETQSTVTGVVLPRSALVRLDGRVFAYVRTGEASFVRREVIDARPIDEGWFVTSGFAPGTAVVVRGAGSLVAVERGGEAGDED